ncbi:MAG TPA: hypothetical protein VGL77_17595 [Armatimonadota bacterium]|jgi:hypothetical protein
MRATQNAFVNSIYLLLFPVWIGLSLFFAGLLALPDIQHGAIPIIALLRTIATKKFISIFAATGFLLLTVIELFDLPRRKDQGIVFIKVRWVSTLFFLCYVLIIVALSVASVSPNELHNDLWTFFMLLTVNLYFWTYPPSLMRTLLDRLVNHDRWTTKLDERFQVVWQLSAASALYWIVGLSFVFGSLYDIMISRQWPLRSLIETSVIFIIWTLAYRYRAQRV